MQDLKREILTQVAAGKISAEEGAARLAALEAEPTAAPAPPVLPEPPASRRVVVVSQFGSAEIAGDPSVDLAIADGPHRVRQDGDTLIIEHEPLSDTDTFAFGRSEGRFFLNGFDPRQRRLTVRMNPDLELRAEVQAGNVRVDGVHGQVAVDVQAGNCTVNDFRGTLRLSAQAGNINASGRLESGASQVDCEMGSVKLNLEKGSSVRITAKTTMGKVSIEGSGASQVNRGGGRQEATVGSGAATLDIECAMGSVKVFAE